MVSPMRLNSGPDQDRRLYSNYKRHPIAQKRSSGGIQEYDLSVINFNPVAEVEFTTL